MRTSWKPRLPQNTVNTLLQTRDGYLWVGTYEGLARFDGIRFTVFNTSNTPAFKSNGIRALCEDARGELWIGTNGGGLMSYSEGRFLHYSAAQGLPNEMVWALAPAADGGLWVGTNGAGLAHFKDGRFRQVGASTDHDHVSASGPRRKRAGRHRRGPEAHDPGRALDHVRPGRGLERGDGRVPGPRGDALGRWRGAAPGPAPGRAPAAGLVAVMLALAAPGLAAQGAPLRYDLRHDGSVRLEVTGQVRVRGEYWDQFAFGAVGAADASGGFVLSRLLAAAKLTFGEHVTLFLQGKSSLVTDRTLPGGQRTSDEDQIDLQQGYVEGRTRIGGYTAALRVGRTDLLLGRERLVSPLDWTNTRRTFQGGTLALSGALGTLTAMVVQPVQVRRTKPNIGDSLRVC